MAGFAFDGLVSAMECVARIRVVVESNELPISADMAGVALDSTVTVMAVVVQMARDASSVELVGKGVFAVAVAAAQLTMMTIQRKIGVQGMVEARILPPGRAVAVLTFLAAPAVMHVVVAVT